MFAYRVISNSHRSISGTQYLAIDKREVVYETDEEDIALLRGDRKFVVYLGKVYRVCQCEIEEDDAEKFIKYWINDPFRGFLEYEQIEDSSAMIISGNTADEIWDILKEHLGVAEGDRFTFISEQMRGCVEFRFGGVLGFGGKFWNYRDKWYVNCYKEDETPERLSLIEKTNLALETLKNECSESPMGDLNSTGGLGRAKGKNPL